MIAAPGTIIITGRRTTGSPRDAPGCAISAILNKTTIVNAVRDLGCVPQDLPRDAPDTPASATPLRPDPLDRSSPTVKRP